MRRGRCKIGTRGAETIGQTINLTDEIGEASEGFSGKAGSPVEVQLTTSEEATIVL